MGIIDDYMEFGDLNIKEINKNIATLEPLYTIEEKLIDVSEFGDDNPGYKHWCLIDTRGKKHLLINVYTADELKLL